MSINHSLLAATAATVILSACMPMKGRPINTENLSQVKHICIRPNPKSDFPDWGRQLAVALQKEGVSSEIIHPRDSAPANCRYQLRYKAVQGNNANTLDSASLIINGDNRQRVGLIKYKLRGAQQQQFLSQPNLQAQTDMLIKRMFKYKYPASADGITVE